MLSPTHEGVKTMGRPWALVSTGVVMILGVFFYLLATMGLVFLAEVPMLTLSGLGLWLLAVSGVKSMEPAVGEMDASTTAGWGALILTVGALGTLSVRGYPLNILIIGFAIFLGILIIFAAVKMWPRKVVAQVKPSSG